MICPDSAENWVGIDRRAARTRSKLHRGLMELCRRKDFETITVNEICEVSGVGRSSFYTHFGNKEALKKLGLAHMRAALDKKNSTVLGAEGDGASDPLPFTQNIFEQAAKHIEWHRPNGSCSPIAVVRDAAADALRRERLCQDQVGCNVVIDGFSGALDFVLRRWLENGATEDPRQIGRAFSQFMEGSLLRGKQDELKLTTYRMERDS